MRVRITRVRSDLPLPTYATPGSVAFDFSAAENVTIPPREAAFVPTGLIIAIPEGHMLLIASRSSLFGKKGLMTSGGVGIIDQDFCGPTDELRLSLWNPGDAPVMIAKGERLCQGIFLPMDRAEWIEEPAEGPSRGGFGSTGV